ncbi:MAG TPA: hypothetical protein VNK41_07425 [Vicinamibacterales bacterium]|nr:hypothetical protein [Vicinamibacterales bacterium]
MDGWNRCEAAATDAFVLGGRVALAALFILGGIQHFIWTDVVAALVPAWIPGPYFWTWFAGIALVARGAGMLVPRTTALAERLSALMVFLWVLMLHVPQPSRLSTPSADDTNGRRSSRCSRSAGSR